MVTYSSRREEEQRSSTQQDAKPISDVFNNHGAHGEVNMYSTAEISLD